MTDGHGVLSSSRRGPSKGDLKERAILATCERLLGEKPLREIAHFPHRVARFTGVPVTHVVADDLRPAPATSPAPTHEREPLGPLSVLAWGGRRSGSS